MNTLNNRNANHTAGTPKKEWTLTKVETRGTERNVNNGRTPCSNSRTPHNSMNAKNGRDVSHSRDASNI